MRKVLCLASVFLLVITVCILPVCATDTGNSTLTSMSSVLNEYDLLSKLVDESPATLGTYGYSAVEIEKINNLQTAYTDYLQQYAKLDDASLKKLGYSDKQIEIFREFTGTENQIRALAATLTVTVDIDYVTWSSTQNRTNARLYVYFEWSGVPLIKTKDIIAVSWNDWNINGKMCYITYTNVDGSGDTMIDVGTFAENDGPASFGGGFTFPMTKQDNTYWGQSGYCAFTLYHNYTRADLSAYAAYGHTTIGYTPVATIPGWGSVSFSIGVEEMDSDQDDMNCEN